jgi:hypothetical protein
MTLPIFYHERYMLLIDAWDIIFIRSYSELIEELKNTNYDLIISSNVINTLEQTNKISKYYLNYFTKIAFGAPNIKNVINCGSYIIKIKTFIDIYNSIIIREELDDQLLLTKYLSYKNHNINYIVDHSRYFFLTLNIDINIENVCMSLKNQTIKPFLIHAHSCSPMDKILKLLFSDITDGELDNMRPNNMSQYKRLPHLLYLLLINNVYNLILLFVIIILFFIKILKYINSSKLIILKSI